MALFGRADSRGHVRCSSFLTNKIIMVDYSKWDKLDYGDDDDRMVMKIKIAIRKMRQRSRQRKTCRTSTYPQVTKLHQPTRVTIGSGESVDFNVPPPATSSCDAEDNHPSKDEKMMSEREFREMQWIEQVNSLSANTPARWCSENHCRKQKKNRNENFSEEEKDERRRSNRSEEREVHPKRNFRPEKQ